MGKYHRGVGDDVTENGALVSGTTGRVLGVLP